jgi:hypothetical protein
MLRCASLSLLTLAACMSSDGPTEASPPPELRAPRLLTPPPNAYVGSVQVAGSLRPTFRWAAREGAKPATSYALQVSTDPKFERSLITISTSETSARLDNALPVARQVPVGARYYWRVRACDDITCSDYSSPRTLNLGRSDHDFNGDGIADVVVGAPTYASALVARVHVYFGATSATFDGVPDGTLVAPVPKDNFGTTVASAGDVNGDGFADVIVGAPEAAGGTGAAYLYLGGAGPSFEPTPDLVLEGQSAGARFGASVAGAGDLDGDGFADFVIGAPGSDGGLGAAFVYYGSTGMTRNTQALRHPGMSLDRFLGVAVAPLGDLDGDGYDDLAVSVNSSNKTVAYLYFGDPAKPLDQSLKLAGDSVGVIAGGADVNGDGFADILLGGAGPSTGGHATLVLGGIRSSLGTDRRTYGELDPGFGATVALPGDVDGDGFADVLIGAGEHDQGATGGVYLYFGGPNATFSTIAASTLISRAHRASEWLVGSPGDVNGDGLADLVIGGVNRDPVGYAGTAYLYAGGQRNAFDAPPLATLTAPLGSDGEFGRSVSLNNPDRL